MSAQARPSMISASARRYVEIFVVIFMASELSAIIAKLQALIEPGAVIQELE